VWDFGGVAIFRLDIEREQSYTFNSSRNKYTLMLRGIFGPGEEPNSAKKGLMMKPNSYVCPECKMVTELQKKPKRTFMGFLRIPCQNCQKNFRYPLTKGYILFYWFLLIFNILLAVSILAQGNLLIPNPVGIIVIVFVIISLNKNSTLKQQVAQRERTIANQDDT
jgi:hypothetical protein